MEFDGSLSAAAESSLSRLRVGLSHMTELSRTLIGRGLIQSLSKSSLRTQGPITPGLKSEKGLYSSAERRVRAVWVPAFVRRDDLLENSICDSPALAGEGWGGLPRAA